MRLLLLGASCLSADLFSLMDTHEILGGRYDIMFEGNVGFHT